MKWKLIISGLILGIVIFPLVAALFHEPDGRVFKARIIEMQTESNDGSDQYFRVEYLGGDEVVRNITQDNELIIYFDRIITRGLSNVKLEPNQEFWGAGYIFTNGTQKLIGVRQIKGTIYWPDQIEHLKDLYWAPIMPIVSIIFFFPSLRYCTGFILISSLLLALTIVHLYTNRTEEVNIIIILLAYILVSMMIFEILPCKGFP